jgi:hypothetical protein
MAALLRAMIISQVPHFEKTYPKSDHGRRRASETNPSAASPRSGDSVRGSPCGEPARLRTGFQGSIPSDPGIRGPLHPPRHRSPPSSYRSGYASVGRLAGGGASAHSVHGLFGNGTLEAGLTVPPCSSYCGGTPGSAFRTGVGRPPPAATPPGPPVACPSNRTLRGTPGSAFHTGAGCAFRAVFLIRL